MRSPVLKVDFGILIVTLVAYPLLIAYFADFDTGFEIKIGRLILASNCGNTYLNPWNLEILQSAPAG
jgi:hypothetical protein